MSYRDLTSIEAEGSKISELFIAKALDAYRQYKSDKNNLLNRIRDNELYYRKCYNKTVPELQGEMECNTSFILSAIENVCADASESYPEANILERSPEGQKGAEALSKLIPVLLDYTNFKKLYKDNTRSKTKYGTAIYGVFFDDKTGDLDIRSVSIFDIFVDMHLEDIQDSAFLFTSTAVDNELLKHQYPKYKEIFEGDTQIDTIYDGEQTLKDRSTVIDCYYKKPDGSVHLMKICNNQLLWASEDDKKYKKGLYRHGKYPFVFDVMFPEEYCPFGFGLIDAGKGTQVTIDKLDAAIVKNIKCNANPRYLANRSSGINEEEFADINKNLIHYDGDADSIKPIQQSPISGDALTHRENKKDELKELLANRDFQQGATSGGVTAASAIEALQQSGEKRARSMINDTYDSFREIIKMSIEYIRQFYNEPRTFRTTDENGRKTFIEFSNAFMFRTEDDTDNEGNAVTYKVPIEFDIKVTAQRENPYTREMLNNTLLTLWQSGVLNAENLELSLILLKNMSFDGKDKLIIALEDMLEAKKKQEEQPPTNPNTTPQSGGMPISQVDMTGGSEVISPEVAVPNNVNEQIPIPIAGAGMV